MSYEPKNRLISDIFYRLQASLPLSGGHRKKLKSEWITLENRISKYYDINDTGMKLSLSGHSDNGDGKDA